jgi:hypothetical protein
VGIELVPKAAEDAWVYIHSLGLPPDVEERCKLCSGDFFEWKDQGFDVGYDYAFFCAMHPSLRETQVCSWACVLKPGAELVTLVFPPPNPSCDPNEGPSFTGKCQAVWQAVCC